MAEFDFDDKANKVQIKDRRGIWWNKGFVGYWNNTSVI